MIKSTFKIYNDRAIASIDMIGEVDVGLEDALNALRHSDKCDVILYGGSLSVEDYININNRHSLQFIGTRFYGESTAEISITLSNGIITPYYKTHKKEIVYTDMIDYSGIIHSLISKEIENIGKMKAGIKVDLRNNRIQSAYKFATIKEEIRSKYALTTYESKGYIRNYKRAIRIQQETDEIVVLLNNSRIQTYKKLV